MQHKNFGLFYIKWICILFWSGWFALACISNCCDFVNATYGLPNYWHFRSGNYLLLGGVFSIYSIPKILVNAFFIMDCLIQGSIASLFFVGAIRFIQLRDNAFPLINSAFLLSLGLWGMFLIFEELFIAYAFEKLQSELFMFELLTLLAIHLLPHKE